MKKNDIVNVNLSDAELSEIDAAIAVIERLLFASLVSLTTEQRRRLPKMGRKSETFCRTALNIMAENPHLAPAKMGLDKRINDVKAQDLLRPRLIRLSTICEHGNDTLLALGSQMMTAALQSYSLLKLIGQNEGLDGLLAELGLRFKGQRGVAASEAEDNAA